MNKKIIISDFVNNAFDYKKELDECSIKNSVNPYLLEFIANGFVKYETVDNFIDNIDVWLRSIVDIFKEIGFNHQTRQLHAVVDLKDQLVIIDEHIKDALEYVINVQKQYGILIKYSSQKLNLDKQTTLLRFFEEIEKFYPKVQDRYKGLGSSSADVSRQTIMDPNSRRVIQVTATNINTFDQLAMLVGDGVDNMKGRKEALMNFKFNMSMIDN